MQRTDISLAHFQDAVAGLRKMGVRGPLCFDVAPWAWLTLLRNTAPAYLPGEMIEVPMQRFFIRRVKNDSPEEIIAELEARIAELEAR